MDDPQPGSNVPLWSILAWGASLSLETMMILLCASLTKDGIGDEFATMNVLLAALRSFSR